jgi:hypothetical protein
LIKIRQARKAKQAVGAAEGIKKEEKKDSEEFKLALNPTNIAGSLSGSIVGSEASARKSSALLNMSSLTQSSPSKITSIGEAKQSCPKKGKITLAKRATKKSKRKSVTKKLKLKTTPLEGELPRKRGKTSKMKV